MSAALDLPPGYRLAGFDTLDSTNEEAKRQALSGAEEGLVVWARRQTAGRGRRGRTWISPEGGLYFSILVRPECPANQAAQLSFLSAVAVGEAAAPHLQSPESLTFKWPNDLLIGGRKVCGILLESGGAAQGVSWLVVGIGLNLASHPENADYPATSLAAEGATHIEAEALLTAIIHSFDGWLRRWRTEAFVPVRSAWLARVKGLGEEIIVRLPEQSVKGVFKALNPDGALILEVPGEGERIISAGDVYFPATE